MRKDLFKFLMLLVVFLTTLPSYGEGSSRVDGIVYSYNILSEEDKTIEIVAINLKSISPQSLVIPKELNGYTTKGLRCGSQDYNIFGEQQSSIKSIQFPLTIEFIGDNVFAQCYALNSVKLPVSLTTIGARAFWGCRGPTSIKFPASLTTIGDNAFNVCVKLTSITLPESLTTIGTEAFKSCWELTSITLPESLTTIGEGAFSSCSALTSITLPESLTTIGDRAFSDCGALTSITLPESLTTIGDRAFSSCGALTSLTIPYSVSEIGVNPFVDCYQLSDLKVEEKNSNYTVIDNVLYDKDITTLICTPSFKIEKSITIPNTVTKIGTSAFYDCKFKYIELPASLNYIGDGAFIGFYNNLREVICHASMPPRLGSSPFQGQDKCILKVPAESINRYEMADGWCNFWNIEAIDASGIKNVLIGDVTVKTVGSDGIIMENADGVKVMVYSIDGGLIYQTSNYQGELINLDSGIYIVKCGDKVMKVKL